MPLYLLACFLGSLLVGLMPFIGVLLVAYGAAVLKTRGHFGLAFLSVVVGGAIYLMLSPVTAVTILFLSVVTVWMVGIIARRFGQGWFFLGAAILAVGFVAIDMFTAYQAGMTLQGQIAAAVNGTMTELTGDGTVPAEALTVLTDAISTILNLWPSFYVMEGFVYASAIVLVGYFSYRRHDEGFKAAPLTEADLSIHVLWVFLAAILCIAAANLPIEHTALISAAGYNLLVCSAVIFCIQGFAVLAFLMRRAHFHWAIRLLIYLLSIQMELMFLAVSIVGLLDFWVNFRKLPRGKTPKDGSQESTIEKG